MHIIYDIIINKASNVTVGFYKYTNEKCNFKHFISYLQTQRANKLMDNKRM